MESLFGSTSNRSRWRRGVIAVPHRRRTPERLNAFSDGVFAFLITVLVLELRPPELPTFKALVSLRPTWLSYAVSYLFIAVVWANHHHLMRYATEANSSSNVVQFRICFRCRCFHFPPLGWRAQAVAVICGRFAQSVRHKALVVISALAEAILRRAGDLRSSCSRAMRRDALR